MEPDTPTQPPGSAFFLLLSHLMSTSPSPEGGNKGNLNSPFSQSKISSKGKPFTRPLGGRLRAPDSEAHSPCSALLSARVLQKQALQQAYGPTQFPWETLDTRIGAWIRDQGRRQTAQGSDQDGKRVEPQVSPKAAQHKTSELSPGQDPILHFIQNVT